MPAREPVEAVEEDMDLQLLLLIAVMLEQVHLVELEVEEDMVVQVNPLLLELQEQLIEAVVEVDPLMMVNWVELVVQV